MFGDEPIISIIAPEPSMVSVESNDGRFHTAPGPFFVSTGSIASGAPMIQPSFMSPGSVASGVLLLWNHLL